MTHNHLSRHTRAEALHKEIVQPALDELARIVGKRSRIQRKLAIPQFRSEHGRLKAADARLRVAEINARRDYQIARENHRTLMGKRRQSW